MFQARVFTFAVRNTSLVAADFRCEVVNSDSNAPASISPFSISPDGGSIPSGGAVNFIVKFAPEETGPFRQTLHVAIANLAPGSKALRRELSGDVIRPWCHF